MKLLETFQQRLHRQVKRMRNEEVSTFKVIWGNHLVEGATWEAEPHIKYRYSHFFPFTPIQT